MPAAPTRIEIPSIAFDESVTAWTTGTCDFLPDESLPGPLWMQDCGSGVGGNNATYIAGHSARDRDTAFNHLFDRWNQVSLVNVGDLVRLTTDAGQQVCYIVNLVDRQDKDWLGTTDAASYPA